MKDRKSPIVTRRSLLQLGAILPFSAVLTSCSPSGTRREGRAAPKSKVNQKSYWARREEWTGEDWVFGVVEIGDRILLINRMDELGWGFPGGKVDSMKFGEKDEKHEDLIRAATEFVHDQALIPIMAKEGIVLAYGYVIDEYRKKVKMVHWINVFSISDILPTPHANLRDTSDARWVAIDDPELGDVLKMRLNEAAEAGEGKTLTLKPGRML